MTAVDIPSTGALSTESTWDSINWNTVTAKVRRLQMRIAKAYREGRYGKAKSLQWILTHSFQAKLLAVKRVVQNKGGKTPGVDRKVWKTSSQKMKATLSLRRRGYQAQPLRRIYIPKKDGRKRPLSIPTMKCRAMQALHLLALEPIAECKADKNSYGFRPKRSTADAMEQCFSALAKKGSAPWILEGDIKACFDKISHSWLKDNILMDKKILEKWLTAGYIDENAYHQTEEGTPQGSLISPTLLTITLSGLEDKVRSLVPKRTGKIYVSIYADDFIITGATKEVLEDKVKPAVESFLRERGLELSHEKTKITHIDEGFDFLGFTIRKYKGQLLTKPSKKNVKSFLEKVRRTIKANPTATSENIIYQLNPLLRGWSNYFRNVCAKRTFSYCDCQIFQAIWQWIRRRHPNKSVQWRKKKYFRAKGDRNWVFSTTIRDKWGNKKTLDLFEVNSTPIRRHIKIRADATPYDPIYNSYFESRDRNKTRSPLNGSIGKRNPYQNDRQGQNAGSSKLGLQKARA